VNAHMDIGNPDHCGLEMTHVLTKKEQMMELVLFVTIIVVTVLKQEHVQFVIPLQLTEVQ